MSSIETLLASKPEYLQLLEKKQAIKLLNLFSDIELGKYDKDELHQIQLNGIQHPFYLRAIRADMQSFVNTFIDAYLEQKPYLHNAQYVIDAGANIGYTAILFANWWPNCKIISIEPDKENYELTVKNTASYPNIRVLHGALWNTSASLQIEAGQEDGFVVREITDAQHSINPQNISTGIAISELLKMYQMPHIDFLKMNIVGSEKEVFTKNYESWLPKTTAMLIELHDGKNAGCSSTVFNTIQQYNFAVAETASYGVLFAQEKIYRDWYAKWYKEEIYKPNINKKRFPKFYLDKK